MEKINTHEYFRSIMSDEITDSLGIVKGTYEGKKVRFLTGVWTPSKVQKETENSEIDVFLTPLDIFITDDILDSCDIPEGGEVEVLVRDNDEDCDTYEPTIIH